MATNSSGGKCFLWFIFLCLGVAGYFVWRNQAKPDGNQETTKSVFLLTPKDADSLLYANVDQRAEYMFERSPDAKYNNTDGTKKYVFYGEGGIYLFFPPNKDYYYISFPKKDTYERFTKQYINFKKIGKSQLCMERYQVSDSCVVCPMFFKDGLECYRALIMKNPNIEESIKQTLSCN